MNGMRSRQSRSRIAATTDADSICLGAAGLDSPGDVAEVARRSSLLGDTAGVCAVGTLTGLDGSDRAGGRPDAVPVGGPVIDSTAGGEAVIVGGAFTSCGVSAVAELATPCCGAGSCAPFVRASGATPGGIRSIRCETKVSMTEKA